MGSSMTSTISLPQLTTPSASIKNPGEDSGKNRIQKLRTSLEKDIGERLREREEAIKLYKETRCMVPLTPE